MISSSLHNYFYYFRVYSGDELPGLKTAVLDAYKRHTPLYIGLLSPQICTDLRGVKNPWKIAENPPIGGIEYTLYFITLFHLKSILRSAEYQRQPRCNTQTRPLV